MKQKNLFSIIGALGLMLSAVVTVGGCRQSHTVIPVVGAVIELPAGTSTIKITAKTANGDAVTVEGCAETSLAHDSETTLHITGSSFVLKGDITDLSCTNGNITNLDVRSLPNLSTLDCTESHVKSLNVQGLTKLDTLNCGKNELESLDLSGLSALTGVDCQENKLKSLNLTGTTMLTELYASKNELESLDLKDCVKLEQLYCNSNKLTALNVKTAAELKGLDCSSNNLSQDAFEKLFESLPQREARDNAMCSIYTEETGVTEGNYTNFTPDELNVAKGRNWKIHKTDADGAQIEL